MRPTTAAARTLRPTDFFRGRRVQADVVRVENPVARGSAGSGGSGGSVGVLSSPWRRREEGQMDEEERFG